MRPVLSLCPLEQVAPCTRPNTTPNLRDLTSILHSHTHPDGEITKIKLSKGQSHINLLFSEWQNKGRREGEDEYQLTDRNTRQSQDWVVCPFVNENNAGRSECVARGG